MGPTQKAFTVARERLDDLYLRHHRPGRSSGRAPVDCSLATWRARHRPACGWSSRSARRSRCAPATTARSGPRLARWSVATTRSSAGSRTFERGPLPVPATSVYTRTDGIVRWFVCLDIVDAQHENVRVRGTHSGLAVNPAALFVIADRLRLREGEWRPFRPPAVLRSFYPSPSDW